MVKQAFRLVSLFFILCMLFSCQKKQGVQEVQLPYVVSTTAMIDELVKQIVQDKIKTSCLIKGDIDPHSYELVKGDRAKLDRADLIIYQGLGLEHGASLVSYLQSENKAIAAGRVLLDNHKQELIYHDGHLDPHVWLDLNLWKKIIPTILNELMALAPEHKDLFEENAQNLIQKMEALDGSMQQLLKQVDPDSRYLVTAHSAFSYFTRRYVACEGHWKERCLAPEGLAPEAQISLYDIEKVVAYIQAHGIKVIFSESNVSKDAMHKIIDVCQKSGHDVHLADEPLFGDALFNGKGYLDMMWHNATLLYKAWDGQAITAQD